VLLLLLVMLPVAKPLLCMPRVALLDPAGTPRLLLWLLECCRTLPLVLLCPEAGGRPALLPMDPEGPVMALAMLLHRA
jgi:hypothetical protein